MIEKIKALFRNIKVYLVISFLLASVAPMFLFANWLDLFMDNPLLYLWGIAKLTGFFGLFVPFVYLLVYVGKEIKIGRLSSNPIHGIAAQVFGNSSMSYNNVGSTINNNNTSYSAPTNYVYQSSYYNTNSSYTPWTYDPTYSAVKGNIYYYNKDC